MSSRLGRALSLLVGSGVIAGAAALWGMSRQCPALPRRLACQLLFQRCVPGPSVQFRSYLSAHGRGPLGSESESTDFRASDCVRASSQYLEFDSEADAENEVVQRLGAASYVLAHDKVATVGDRLPEERAVLTFPQGRDSEVLRRKGSVVHILSSRSLDHALELERRLAADKSEQYFFDPNVQLARSLVNGIQKEHMAMEQVSAELLRRRSRLAEIRTERETLIAEIRRAADHASAAKSFAERQRWKDARADMMAQKTRLVAAENDAQKEEMSCEDEMAKHQARLAGLQERLASLEGGLDSARHRLASPTP